MSGTRATRRFGKALRLQRQGKAWTQAVLAKKIGRKRHNVMNLESGRYAPTYETLVRLVRALGCSASDLVR
jgi:transcriptional regulator with XRE-family HTH domain